MTPAEILTWTLGIHVGVIPLAVAGFYKYTDRTDIFKRSIAEADDLLQRMREHAADALEEKLSPVFQRSRTEPLIVTPFQYSERPTNPIGSDAYREAFREFIDMTSGVLIDYGQALKARTRWCRWARLLSWTVYLFALWEVVCVALFGLVGKLLDVTLPDRLAVWSFAPTALLVLFFFLSQGIMLRQHDVIHNFKERHADV